MKKKQVLFSILLCSIILNSCDLFKGKRKGSGKDTFYSDKGGFDRPRIPLIKPYELLKVGAEWRMELLTTDLLTLSVHNVKGVNVSKERILLYSEGGTEVRNNQYSEAWFIIDPSLKMEVAFFDYNRYVDSLKTLGIVGTSLGIPNELYKDFYNTGKLKWIPGEKPQ